MVSIRLPFLALGGAFLFTASLAFSPVAASACQGEKGAACACGAGAAHAEGLAGDHAGGCNGEAKPDDGKAAGEKPAGCTCGGGGQGACTCAKGSCSKHGSCGGKAPGGCSEEPAAPGAKPESNAGGSDSHQVAIVDPATGQVIEPTRDEAEAANPGSASAREIASTPREVAQPGGGVMAAFPKEHSSNAVATLDDAGKVHTDCAENAQ